VTLRFQRLARAGAPPPSAAPLFSRASAAPLTQAPVPALLGGASSGEAEPGLVSLACGMWLGLDPDHTDRAAEARGVALSKPPAPPPWRLDEVAPHWDPLMLRGRNGEEATRSPVKRHCPRRARRLTPTAMKDDRWYCFLPALRRRAETSGFLGFRRTAGGPHSRPRHEA